MREFETEQDKKHPKVASKDPKLIRNSQVSNKRSEKHSKTPNRNEFERERLITYNTSAR
jgi:hypothetical protein